MHPTSTHPPASPNSPSSLNASDSPTFLLQIVRAVTTAMVIVLLVMLTALGSGCTVTPMDPDEQHLAPQPHSPRNRRPGPLATPPESAAASGPRWYQARLDRPDAVFAGYSSPTQSTVTTFNRTGTIQTFRGLRNTGGSESTVIVEQNVVRP